MTTPVILQVGDRWFDEHGPVRIMALVEGYVLVRRPRAMPFVVAARTFARKFTAQKSGTGSRAGNGEL